MGIENLAFEDVLYGSLSLILVIISLIVGARILSKYLIFKEKTLITIGFLWMLNTSAWWVSASSFVLLAIFDYKYDAFTYLLIENIFSPIALVLWIYSFTTLAYRKYTKILTSIYFVLSLIFEIALIIMLSIDTELIGTGIEEGIFTSQLIPFAVSFQVFCLFTAIVTGFLFSYKSLKSEDPKIKWKGRFLLLAFSSFVIGALLEALFLLDPISLILCRLLLIFSTIEFYFGFFFPERIKKYLLKEN